MSARQPTDRHSDLGPSSKDWQTGSAGRDEDFTPEKDLWTISRKGNTGAGRPGEDVHSESAASGNKDTGEGIQPGTHREGRSWQSRRPESGNEDDKLDQALKDTFPTSDPPQPAQPGVTGWDLGEGASRGRSSSRHYPAWGQVRTAMPGWVWIAAAAALLPVLASVARGRTPQRRSRPRRRGS